MMPLRRGAQGGQLFVLPPKAALVYLHASDDHGREHRGGRHGDPGNPPCRPDFAPTLAEARRVGCRPACRRGREAARFGGGIEDRSRAQQCCERALASRTSGEVRLQTGALDPAEPVFVVRRNHVGGGTLGTLCSIRLIVSGTACAAKRDFDRGRETVI